jgi:hypothetical protein
LASFPAIIGDGKGKPSLKHKIRHTIETTGRPVFAKAHRMDPDKLRQAEAEFQKLEAAGIIHRPDSPWVVAAAHGLQEGQVVAALRRLPPTQPGDDT